MQFRPQFEGEPFYFLALYIYYISRGLRPDRNWTLTTSLGHAFWLCLFGFSTAIRIKPTYLLKPGSLKDRFVLASPTEDNAYSGSLDRSDAKPKPIGGVWYPKAPTREEIRTKKVVLLFPGGAYVSSTDPARMGVFPSQVYAEKMDAMLFFAQYRVGSDGTTKFHAALQDSVTFYSHLLELGVPAENIIISGISAGGNLALTLLRYIEENKNVLPSLRGVIIWSPWADVTGDSLERCKQSKKMATDTLRWNILEWCMQTYFSSASSANADAQPYISPAQHLFHTRTPLMVHVGGVEIFRDDVSKFAKDVEGVEGNDVMYFETPGAPHDLILCGQLNGLRKETSQVVEAARKFFESGMGD